MRVSGKISGTQKLLNQLDGLGEAARQTAIEGLSRAAIAVHQEAIRGIQKVSGGEVVTRYNPKREVTVSIPGDPFNSDTGGTVATIHFEVDEKELKAAVGSNSLVAMWLEVGTAKMAARSWLLPALQKVKGDFTGMFKFKRDVVKS